MTATLPEKAERSERWAPPPEGKSVLHILDHTGDTKYMWSPDNPDEVAAAKKHFKNLKDKGFLAYKVDDKGEKGEVIREFDERAGKIIMSKPLQGG